MDELFRKKGTTEKFFKSAVWNQLGKTCQFMMSFLMTVVISRKLGKALYGEYSWFISFCLFVGLFLQLGFENILNTFIPKLMDYPGRVSFLVKRILSLRIIIIFAGCVILLFLSPVIETIIPMKDSSRMMGYAIAYVIFTNLASILSRVLVSLYRLKYLSLVNMIISVFQLLMVYILLTVGYGLNTLLLIITTVSALACCFYLAAMKKIFQTSSESFNLKPLYSFGRTSWLTGILEFGLGKQIDILLIGYFIAIIAEAGFYNIGISVPLMISGLVTAGLGGVLLATFSEIEEKREENKFGEAWQSMIKLQFTLSAPIIAFLIAYSGPIIKNVYSDSYLPAATIMQIFSIFYFAQKMMGGGTHITALYAMNLEKVVLKIRFVGGLLNLFLNIALIPIYGAVGAIFGTGLSALITVSLEFVYLQRILRCPYPVIFILKVCSAIIAVLIILRFFQVQTVLSLLGAGIGYVLLLLILLYLLKPLNIEDQRIVGNLNNSWLKWLSSFYG
jgi:O-antigen/teichoic acid export membrane protein